MHAHGYILQPQLCTRTARPERNVGGLTLSCDHVCSLCYLSILLTTFYIASGALSFIPTADQFTVQWDQVHNHDHFEGT